MAVSADEAQLRQDIDESIADDDAIRARALIAKLWRQRPGPALAGFVTGRLRKVPAEPTRSQATVAIVRSFTVEPAVPVLKAAAAVNGIDLTVHVGDFNTYGQDLLDPSRPLHAEWDADVVIVAVQLRDVGAELCDGFASTSPEDIDKACTQIVDQFTAMVEGFRRLSNATLVIHGFEQPTAAALGVADRTAERSQRRSIQSLNDRLAELADAHRGVHILDYDALIARDGRARWHDAQKWHLMKAPVRADRLADLADEWLRFIQPAIGKVAKVLAVDLDNTLWGGVLGEDGIDGIRVGPDSSGAGYAYLQRSILALRARGILLAVCSKNNHADVIEALERHPEMLVRPESFSAIRANWDSKVDNLRAIAAELNIGIDSVAFLDDSPYECNLVREVLSEVTVIELDREPTDEWNPIERNPLFERLTLLDEDRNRATYYDEQRSRQDALDAAHSVEEYLQSLGTKVSVDLATPPEIERVAQLTQKTNQFNLTTRRYSESDITAFVDDPAYRVWATHAADRFGDHGLIGVVIARADAQTWSIDTMLLSCRVIGRGVERAMLAVVADEVRANGALALEGEFIPTAKNAPAGRFYEESGFEQLEAASQAEPVDATTWRLPLGESSIEPPPWIELQSRETRSEE